MIVCKNITKIFSEQVVLNSFSYTFNNTGFYLLFGESGSGKTTLLNILSGFLPFESGNIIFGNYSFTQQVNNELIKNDFDYITQDAFFVDFLSVMDNMRLISNNDSEILKNLDRFNLKDKVNQKPSTLSGGEKQRLAIARAIIRNKKVLFLDEPTAALDDANKNSIFELLAELKQSVLIICSSHDEQAKIYADAIITFSKEKISSSDLQINTTSESTVSLISQNVNYITRVYDQSKNKKIPLFLKQWFVSEHRNKKTNIFFTVFLVISLCICIFADTPQKKLDTSIEQMYKINMMTVITTSETNWEDIAFYQDGIREVVLNYNYSCPNGTENITDENLMIPEQPHEISLNVLPFDADNFKLSYKILHGTYFTDENQIILSAEMAKSLYPSSPEKLIGSHLTKNIYSFGEISFEIVGIFDYFNDFEKMYLNALSVNISTGKDYNSENYKDLFFANSKLTDKLSTDKTFYSGTSKQRAYNIYFDSYKAMKTYFDKYSNEFETNKNVSVTYTSLNYNLYDVFELMFFIMLPIAIFVMLFTVLFFITLKKTEYIYNSRFIAIFEYAGYSKKRVINYFILMNIFELIKYYCIAAVIAFIFTVIVNIINSKYVIVNFQIFSYNLLIISLFLVLLILSAFIFATAMFRRVKVASWYENLISRRDLL